MRKHTLLLAVALLPLAGCDSVSDRLQSQFSAEGVHSRVYHGDPQMVSSAVVLALKRLEFTVGAPADGADHIEASGKIQHGEGMNGARQLLADIKLVDAGPGEMEVQLVLSEQTDDGTPTGRAEKHLRQSGFYGTFFDTVQEVLKETFAPQAEHEAPQPHTTRE